MVQQAGNIINAPLTFVNATVEYLKENLWPIFLLVVFGYILKDQAIKYYESRRGQKLNSTSRTTPDKNNKNNNATEVDREELLKVRLRQQQIANERAIEAAKIRKKKEEEERERKNQVAKERKQSSLTTSTNENRLGRASDTGTGGYNPLQPWSSNSGGGGYRPQSRHARRG